MAKSKRKRKSKVTLQKAGSIISISTLNLKMELEEEEERSGPGRIKFISLNFIADLYRQRNPSKLTLSLENDLRTIAREGEEWWVEDLKIERIAKDWQIRGIKIEELEEYVRTQASKLYALLLLLHQSQVIIPLYKQEHRVTDSIFDQSDVEGDEPYCLMEFLQTHNQLSRFAVKFFEAQWRIPSRLCRDTVPTFPPATFHFPYVGELESIARGAYGEVFKVKVAVGHLIGDAKHGYVTVSRQSNAGYEYQLKYRQGSVVAHKQIEKKKHMTEELVMQEVNTIRAREHPNIVKFLAAFSAGRLLPWRPNDATKCLHMLFEHTSAGTMQDWLDRDDPPELLADVSTRRRHVKKSVEKLVEAVAWIHKKIGGYSAYHHDLKPSNILRFEGPPATWKICDFGMANLKRPDDNSGTTHRFDNVFGSYIYQPPEYFSSDQSFSHGRPFDVWSLGCIILELLTVWKHGWGKISCREFYKERGANTNLLSYNRWYQRQSASEDHSYHNNPTVVKDWMSRLREEEGADADPWFCHSLGLVEEMLAEKEMRVFIWEVHMDLYEMAHPVLKDRQLKEYFRSVVQASDTPLNNLSRSHNPLKRAKEHGKHWQEQVLRDEAWSVDSPDPTPQLKLRRHDTGWKFSTLSACSNAEEFTRDKLYGRHAIDAMIAEGFRNSNLVGLYGMSGVG
jgi:serine/threonine protein kinase